MYKRTSLVNQIDINALAIASSFEIGDSTYIHAFSRALAVQREYQLFFDNEGRFEDYIIFNKPIPFEPLTENLVYDSTQLTPIVKVGSIDIIGISTSSILHIGSSKNVYLESRIKHIRQLQPRE